MTFYDYDMRIERGGIERYILCANMKPLVALRYCVVSPHPDLPGWWLRATRWRSRHGVRYEPFKSLDAALTSGIKWARRRQRAEA